MNIKSLLNFGINFLKDNNIEEATLKAKILLAYILNVRKEYLIIHDEDEVSKEAERSFKEKLNELKKGKPIQYITCKQEFMGLNFYVNENVLIPQPDTEVLVEEVIEKTKQNVSKKLLDICTGSGAIAVSIARNMPNIEVVASDISEKALKVAMENAKRNNVKIRFILSDMFENIAEKFDFIVSNPPYIENGIIAKLSSEVQCEPYIALAGGEDGLDFYRIIANHSKEHLKQGGCLAVEIGYNQKASVIKIFEQEGYKEIYSKKDFGDNDRIVVAKI